MVGTSNSQHRSTEHTYAVLHWWCVACSALLFTILGVICYGPDTLNFDLDVSHWIQDRNASWADPLASFGNTIGEAAVASGFLIASLILGGILKRWQDIWFVLVVAAGRLFSVFLKGWFESPRPDATQVRVQEAYDNLGFPSGHALTSTVVAGAFVYLIARQFPNPRIIVFLEAFWLLAIGCTAFARIWVGAHWLTDTLGGALLGIFIVLMAANVSTLLVNRWPGTSHVATP